MAEIATYRKNKIELTEYDCSKDVENRILMSKFTPFDVEILEEILFSPLRIPLSVLEQNLELSPDKLLPILEKLSATKLFQVIADHVIVDKEMRKYYEMQLLKFEEDFKPGMEYLQGLLRKVPIHILPTWYSISRTSNNIFDSIVEKYLQTPQTFQRYLMELNLPDSIQKGIMNDLYQSPNYEIDAEAVIKKFNLTQEQFEEHMIELEFYFVCCVKYVREKGRFKQVITPFHEWRQYLCHVRETEPTPIIEEEAIKRVKTSNFAIVEEMSAVVEQATKAPITAAAISSIRKECPEFSEEDFSYYVEKLCELNLLSREGEKYTCTSDSEDWLKMATDARAIYLFRHPLNSIRGVSEKFSDSKHTREAEKSIARVANVGWVDLEEFVKGIFIPLNENHIITLRRQGRTWKYQLPQYSTEETAFFKAVIQSWLFEVGITALGTYEGRECFCLTPLGNTLFGDE